MRIRREWSSNSYTRPITDDFIRDALRMAKRLQEIDGEPYSFQAACLSYMLDTDRGKEPKAQADYVRIWGWTRKEIRLRWPEIVETVANLRTSFGRLSRGQSGASEGPERGQKIGDSSPESRSEGQSGASEGPERGQLTNTTPTKKEEKKSPTSRDGEASRNGHAVKKNPPTEDDCRLAHLLFELICESDEKARPPNFDRWSEDVEKLRRIDKRTPEEIEAVIRWAQADSFWQSNILSTEKLRKQFSKLFLQMKRAAVTASQKKPESIQPTQKNMPGIW